MLERSKKLLEELAKALSGRAERKKHLTRYFNGGNTKRPMTDLKPIDTQETLEPGVYNVGADRQGIYFSIAEQHTDALLRFEDERYQIILDEVKKFWTLEDNFKRVGFTMKRGIMLHGAPGCGKSSLVKLLQEATVNEGHIVFISHEIYSLPQVLKAAKEIEPNRKVMVVLEDVDTQIQHGGENKLLELFDGPDQQDKVCYIGTTNYLNKLPPRVLRSGRFDRKLEILNPPKAGRVAYLQAKLGLYEESERIEEMADKTVGFSFGDLREFVVSVFCLEYDEDTTIERIKTGGLMEKLETRFSTITGCADMSEKSVTKILASKAKKSGLADCIAARLVKLKNN